MLIKPKLNHSIKNNAQSIRSKNPLPYKHCAFFGNIYRPLERMGQQSVQRQSSDFTYELRDEYKAEANVVVAVSRGVVVAISATTILRIVIPATTAQHTIRTYDRCPF
jgi:hypothetical protein